MAIRKKTVSYSLPEDLIKKISLLAEIFDVSASDFVENQLQKIVEINSDIISKYKSHKKDLLRQVRDRDSKGDDAVG